MAQIQGFVVRATDMTELSLSVGRGASTLLGLCYSRDKNHEVWSHKEEGQGTSKCIKIT